MRKYYFFWACISTLVVSSCSSEKKEGDDVTPLTVITSDVSGITSTSATCGGNVTADGGSPVTTRGVVWNTTGNPTAELTTKTADGSGTGVFTSSLSGLTKETTYYVRAYAVNSKGIAYGEQKTFKTGAEDVSLPSVKTSEVSSVSATSALCGGTVDSEGSSSVTARGVVWNTSADPTVDLKTKTADGTGKGAFTSTITGLTKETVYYVRAYATNEKGTSYGEQKTFKTKGDAQYEYVDLGLSVKWATFNVGADTPEGTGDFFAWGEVQPYYADGYSQKSGSTVVWRDFTTGAGNNPHSNADGYAWENYSTGGIGSFVEWNTAPYDAGTLILNSDRDAATVNWGSEWRTPTIDEFAELYDTLKMSWTYQSSPAGYVITSKMPGYEGNSIFLPNAGWREGNSYQFTADQGFYYWSSSLRTSKYSYGYLGDAYVFMRKGTYISTSYYTERCQGNPIRPVTGNRKETPWVKTISVDSVSYNTATCDYQVTSDSGYPVTARGVVWSKSPNPTADLASKTVDGTGMGDWQSHSKLTGLEENTTYYVRAYATNEKGTSYGGETKLTTKGKDATVEYVDLGLSVKWATCNVGASKPADYGDYFAWGEVKPYYADGYSQESPCTHWRNYTTGSGNNPTVYGAGYSLATYCNYPLDTTEFVEWTNVPYGENGVLKSEYDAATSNRGGDWRMPTEEEMNELLQNCEMFATVRSGIYGIELISTKTGYTDASIFLPMSGSREGKELFFSLGPYTKTGVYWTSVLSVGLHILLIDKYYSFVDLRLSDISRCIGGSVRPVYTK